MYVLLEYTDLWGEHMNSEHSIWDKLDSKIKHFKIRTKFFFAFVITSLVLILLLGSIFQYISVRILYKNTQSFTGEFLEQVSNNMENKTENLMESTYELMTDSEFKYQLRSNAEVIGENGMGRYRQAVRVLGAQHFTIVSPVSAFYARGSLNELSWWGKYREGHSITETDAAKVMEQCAEYMEDYNTYWFSQGDRIFLARNMIDTDTNLGEVYGTVVFEIEKDFFEPIQSENKMISNDSLIFENNTGRLVIGKYKDFIEKTVARNVEKKGGSDISMVTWQGEDFIFTERTTGNSVWSVFCMIPEQVFMESTRTIQWYICGIAVGAILFSLWISYILSKNLSQNIHYLEKNMRKVEQGDFNIHINPTSYDEIGMLCDRFNYMADRINELVDEAYREGEVNQKLQFQVLKAQINPHFLYNSLGSIRCMAKMKGQNDIEQMTAALIELLRTSLSKTGEFQTVREEVGYIQNYFTLQMFRYENSFEVSYELGTGTRECIILNFILQPLVENAIFHGIEISKGTGKIKITSDIREKKLRLTVEDNGVGMTEEKIREILTVQTEKYEGLNSIGVANVSQRIKKYFGDEYGLTYISKPGNGSIAEIWLPVMHSMKEVEENVKNHDSRG